MQGTSETTSQCSKTVTSYLSSEILWGQRFKECVKYDESLNAYRVNHKEFNKTEEVLTPLCSGRRLQEVFINTSCCVSSSAEGKNECLNLNEQRMSDVEPKLENKIDSDIYSYLSDIKEKIHGKVKPVPNYNMLKHKDNMIDVECLIESLQKYVADNNPSEIDSFVETTF